MFASGFALLLLLPADWSDRLRDANRLHNEGQHQKARTQYEALLEEAKQPGEPASRAADVHNNLGAHFFDRGQYAEAERQYTLAMEAWSRTGSGEGIGFGLTLNNLSALYRVTGRHDAAVSTQRRALAIFERKHSAEHLQTSLNNLAEAYRTLGDYAAARRTAAEALTLAERIFGADHPRVAHCLHALGNAQQNGGDPAKARDAYLRAIAIREKHLGPAHPLLAATLANLASNYLQDGQPEKAAGAAERAVAILEEHYPSGHPNLVSALNNLAQVRRAQGAAAEAEPLYRKAISMSQALLGSSHPDTAILHGNLGEMLFELGRFQASAVLLERASGSLDPSAAWNQQPLATLQATRAVVYAAMQRRTEAESLLRRWLPVMERVLGSNAPRTVQSRRLYDSLVQQTVGSRGVTRRSYLPEP